MAALVAVVSFTASWLSSLEVESAGRVWVRSPGQAYARLDHAARLNPLSDEPYVVAGSIALRRGELARANHEFALALERTPGEAYATLERGAIASTRGRRREALALLERAVRLAPRDPLTRAALAVVRAGHRVDIGAQPLNPGQFSAILMMRMTLSENTDQKRGFSLDINCKFANLCAVPDRFAGHALLWRWTTSIVYSEARRTGGLGKESGIGCSTPKGPPRLGSMRRNRIILGTLAMPVLLAVLAPAALAGGPLLSGYGGPGAGAQAIIGGTLLNGPKGGSGGGAGGSAGSSSSSSSSVSSSSPSSSSSATNASRVASGRGPATPGGSGGRVVEPSPPAWWRGQSRQAAGRPLGALGAYSSQSHPEASVVAASASAAGSSWFTGGDLLALVLAAGVLTLVAVATVRLSGMGAHHG